MMKKSLLYALLSASLLVASCGYDHGSQPVATTQILSDAVYDGDIAQDPVTLAYTVTQGTAQSYFAGIDPATNIEYRTFLDFPLGGFGGVPLNAVIVSASLDIVVTSISPQPLIGTIPIRIDLVFFQPPTLIGTDFNRTDQPALATITIAQPISQADFGRHVVLDVTPLMVEAQRRGLPDFQIRVLEDFGFVTAGVIEINDTTGPFRNDLAPLLQVSYY